MQLPFDCSTLWRKPRGAVGATICKLYSCSWQLNSIKRYKEFKEFNKRICVATDVFGRGIDIERINLAINYDLPADADSYLHRVGRAGRFGTKGVSISFVSSEADEEVMKSIGKRFEVGVSYVTNQISKHPRSMLTES